MPRSSSTDRFTEITVRQAYPDDLDRIEAFQAAALRILGKREYERHAIDRYIAEIGTMPAGFLENGRFFVLEYRGDIVATGGWRWQADDGAATTGFESGADDGDPTLRGTFAEIGGLYVDPMFARIGLASWLLATLENDIARLGIRETRIAATLTGLAVCQKNGYQPYRLAPVRLADGTEFHRVALAKAIAAKQISATDRARHRTSAHVQ